MVASLEYNGEGGEQISLATLQGFVPNQGEAWEFTQESLRAFFERVRSAGPEPSQSSLATAALIQMAGQEPPSQARDLIGAYLDWVRLLGQRTAEMHLVLSDEQANSDFMPQPFTTLYQRSLYQSMRSLVGKIIHQLHKDLPNLPAWACADAQAILDLEAVLLQRFRAVADQPITALRTRCHGDYHLEQVLYTGDDFVIFDFEGEADRPVLERRLKTSPLRDVAGMLRSLCYATYAARLSCAEAEQ